MLMSATGEPMKIAASRQPKFKAGMGLLAVDAEWLLTEV